jgi:hypothetical protein
VGGAELPHRARAGGARQADLSVAPPTGFEPATSASTGPCSSTELRRHSCTGVRSFAAMDAGASEDKTAAVGAGAVLRGCGWSGAPPPRSRRRRAPRDLSVDLSGFEPLTLGLPDRCATAAPQARVRPGAGRRAARIRACAIPLWIYQCTVPPAKNAPGRVGAARKGHEKAARSRVWEGGGDGASGC